MGEAWTYREKALLIKRPKMCVFKKVELPAADPNH